MTGRRTVRALGPALCGLLVATAGCAPAGAPQPTPGHLLQLRDWQFHTAEHIALWYHGLAHTGTAAALTQDVLPLYDPVYVEQIAAARRAAGVPETALERQAGEFSTLFRGAGVWSQLEFLPLYFDNVDALMGGLRVWEQLGGDPRRAGNQETAAAVALLSGFFPTAAQRRSLSEWRVLLEEERRLFHASHWAAVQPELQRVAAAAAAEWTPLAAQLRPLLNYFGLAGGDVYLVPALGPEGRLLPRGAGRPRVAVEVPGLHGEAAAPGLSPARHVVYSFIHELFYPFAGESVREHVSPARARELGAERLELNTAVRAGAMALERLAPGHLDGYRRYYLHAAGRAAAGAIGASDFEAAFPLPPELASALAQELERALAGI
jgi:hypothetical protein